MGFVVLFGAMSLFHFPVMAFGSGPHSAHAHAIGHLHHSDQRDIGHANPSGAAKCDGFACFLAVEPALFTSRPLQAILFGALRFERSDFRLALAAQPDLPPPRLQG